MNDETLQNQDIEYWAWPSTLLKAMEDSWYYAMELKSGQQLIFGCCETPRGQWVHLLPVDDAYGSPRDFTFDIPLKPSAISVSSRGLCVHLDAIAWVCDGDS